MPIYWEKIKDFLLNESFLSEHNRYNQIKIGNSEKTCLLYGNIDEKKSFECDFYLSIFDILQRDKKDLFWSSEFIDESLNPRQGIAFLPCAKSIQRNENCDTIIFLIDEDISPQTQIIIDYLSSFFKNTKKYLSSDIEWAKFSDIESDILCCKKFISFSNHKILNQYFSVLFGNDFILCADDESSPLRYAYVNMRHPNLRDKAQSLPDKNCEFKYSVATSNFRSLVVEIEKDYEEIALEITPEIIFKEVERQCLTSMQPNNRNYMHCFMAKGLALPFSLEGWAHHKKSLSELMNFVENHKEQEDMRKLLLAYLLVYMPLDYWKMLEQYYADDPAFSLEFKKNIDAISENTFRDYIFKWACGTYIRALKDDKIYPCCWNDKSLASCLDLALNHKENEMIEKVKQLYSLNKYKDHLGLNLVEIFVDNHLMLKKEMSADLIKVCYSLLDLDVNYGYDNYGARIFYKTVLRWMENKFNDIIEFFKQTLDVVKTRGFLAKTALFLLKQKRFDFKEIAIKLLALDDNTLLAKNPKMLQLKWLAYLDVGDYENANICEQAMRLNEIYFKNFYLYFDKWYVQSCIEHKLKHFDREKRFKFIHKNLGIPSLWEAFE